MLGLPGLLQGEVRCGGGCRDRKDTACHSATVATASLSPGSSLPALGWKNEVIVRLRGLQSEDSYLS